MTDHKLREAAERQVDVAYKRAEGLLEIMYDDRNEGVYVGTRIRNARSAVDSILLELERAKEAHDMFRASRFVGVIGEDVEIVPRAGRGCTWRPTPAAIEGESE